MPARRWRSSRPWAATNCSGAPKPSSQRAADQMRAARARVAELGEWFSHMEGRQAALREQVRQFNDSIDAIERALFEAQYEEEQLSYEWEIEREIDEKPRIAMSALVVPQRRAKALPQVRRDHAAVHHAVQRARYAGHAAAADRRQRPASTAARRAPADGRAAEAAAGAGRDAEAEGEGRAEARSRSRFRSRRPSRKSRSSRRRNRMRKIRASSRSASGSPRRRTIRSSASSACRRASTTRTTTRRAHSARC